MSEARFRDGFWFNDKVPCTYFIASGGRMDVKAMTCVDYPKLEGEFQVPIKFGDYGPTRKEIAEATGMENYNLKLEFFYDYYPETPGVINDEGTEITIWGGSDSLEALKWMSDQEFEKMKQSLDHKAAPRQVW